MCGLCGAGGELCRYEAAISSSGSYQQNSGNSIDYQSNSYNPSEFYE